MLDGFTLAVIIAAVVNIVLGALWYNPNFLGKAWAFTHGFREDALKGTPKTYAGAFLVGFVIAYVLGLVLNKLQVNTVAGAMTSAFWLWLGFIVTTHFSGVLWAKKPFQAYLIDVGFYLVSFQAMAIVFALFS